MNLVKTFEICPKCGKEITLTASGKNYYRHLSKHNNPSSRLCTTWYKKYFKKVSSETSACTICDEEIYHDIDDPFSNHQYSDHLKTHGIAQN
jgi:hypothetical protein